MNVVKLTKPRTFSFETSASGPWEAICRCVDEFLHEYKARCQKANGAEIGGGNERFRLHVHGGMRVAIIWDLSEWYDILEQLKLPRIYDAATVLLSNDDALVREELARMTGNRLKTPKEHDKSEEHHVIVRAELDLKELPKDEPIQADQLGVFPKAYCHREREVIEFIKAHIAKCNDVWQSGNYFSPLGVPTDHNRM